MDPRIKLAALAQQRRAPADLDAVARALLGDGHLGEALQVDGEMRLELLRRAQAKLNVGDAAGGHAITQVLWGLGFADSPLLLVWAQAEHALQRPQIALLLLDTALEQGGLGPVQDSALAWRAELVGATSADAAGITSKGTEPTK